MYQYFASQPKSKSTNTTSTTKINKLVHSNKWSIDEQWLFVSVDRRRETFQQCRHLCVCVYPTIVCLLLERASLRSAVSFDRQSKLRSSCIPAQSNRPRPRSPRSRATRPSNSLESRIVRCELSMCVYCNWTKLSAIRTDCELSRHESLVCLLACLLFVCLAACLRYFWWCCRCHYTPTHNNNNNNICASWWSNIWPSSRSL